MSNFRIISTKELVLNFYFNYIMDIYEIMNVSLNYKRNK